MKITDLNGKNVCIVGFGKEGHATLSALKTGAPNATVTIADRKADLTHPEYPVITGDMYLKDIEAKNFDVIIKSPGISPHPLFGKWKHEKRLTSATEIFFDTIVDSGATVIGVTGSKGKSTTSSLIHAMLPKSILIGNIGEPAIAHIQDAKKGAIFVMELSSYQLMDLTVSPHIAVVTSFFPEHLDYHESVENYLDAKANITKHQTANDLVFFCTTSPGAVTIAQEGHGTKIPFSADDCPVAMADIALIGEHNLSNIAGAYKVALHMGANEKDATTAIKNFRGLPHRLQSLGVHHEIEWIDDAISTTPESAIAALDALGDKVTTIILGGQDRGNDFTALGKRIAASKIKTVILFPGSGPRIKQAITDAKANVTFIEADSMEKAVERAKFGMRNSKLGITPIVLLSTASPSYGMFKNFEEKGDLFKQFVTRA